MGISIVPASAVPEVFVERLENRQSGDQALVTSMTVDFADNPVTQALIENGLEGDIFAIDRRGHEHGSGAVIARPESHRVVRDEFAKEFAGRYVVLGEASGRVKDSLIHRSHIKAKIVGNRVLSLGDVNCAPYCFESTVGLMLDFESEDFASFLLDYVESGGNLRNREGSGENFWLMDDSEVLIDYGKNGRSITLEKLLNDLSNEGLESVRMSSSYIPYGKLDEVLSYHDRVGKVVVFYSNRPSKFRAPNCPTLERYFQRFNAAKARTGWVDLLPDKLNHLKAAILAYEDGSRVAYVGSNTFHEFPVRAGTAEAALRTTNTELIDEIEAFMIDNLEPS